MEPSTLTSKKSITLESEIPLYDQVDLNNTYPCTNITSTIPTLRSDKLLNNTKDIYFNTIPSSKLKPVLTQHSKTSSKNIKNYKHKKITATISSKRFNRDGRTKTFDCIELSTKNRARGDQSHENSSPYNDMKWSTGLGTKKTYSEMPANYLNSMNYNYQSGYKLKNSDLDMLNHNTKYQSHKPDLLEISEKLDQINKKQEQLTQLQRSLSPAKLVQKTNSKTGSISNNYEFLSEIDLDSILNNNFNSVDSLKSTAFRSEIDSMYSKMSLPKSPFIPGDTTSSGSLTASQKYGDSQTNLIENMASFIENETRCESPKLLSKQSLSKFPDNYIQSTPMCNLNLSPTANKKLAKYTVYSPPTFLP